MNEKLILGIHLIGHDLSLTLTNCEGKIIFIAEEERYSKIKGGNFIFSTKLIQKIFSEILIPTNSIQYIGVVGEPDKWPKSKTYNLSYNPVSRFFHKSLWEKELLAIFPNVKNIFKINHHLAHAACAYFSSKYRDACIITMDAYGDNETATIYHAKNDRFKKLFSVPFHHSHVYLYEAFAGWLGLNGKEKAGKLMGLSSYGTPIYSNLIQKFFSNNNQFFLSKDFSTQIAKPDIWIDIIEEKLGKRNIDRDKFNQFQLNIASSIQKRFEEETVALFHKARCHVPSSNVCCAGGGFYNSVSNGKLIKSDLYNNYYFHPIAGDSGLSLGAAQLISSKLECKRPILQNVYYGSTIDSSKLKQHSLQKKYTIVEYSDFNDLVSYIANKISDGKIVGWCQGNMEVGPRALGNRSIFADPRDKNNVAKLNTIKRREHWRPFASSVLNEDASLLFDITSEFPYMNVVAKVLHPELIPASCHIDGTARVQTVKGEDNRIFYNLLTAFKKSTGISVFIKYLTKYSRETYCSKLR